MSKWIDVRDRLPEYDMHSISHYIIRVSNGSLTLVRYAFFLDTDNEGVSHWGYVGKIRPVTNTIKIHEVSNDPLNEWQVTHWQDLPLADLEEINYE